MIVPEVLQEIKGLEKSKLQTTSRRARLARRTIENTKLFQKLDSKKGSAKEREKSTRDVDELLIEFVKERPTERILATMDRTLLSRTTELGLPYLTLSNGKPLFSKRMRVTYLTPTKG